MNQHPTVVPLIRRQWVIEIRSPWISANHRMPWRQAMGIKKAIRAEVMGKARLAHIPNLTGRCAVLLTYTPRQGRGPDPDNLVPTMKAAVDGLQSAGVLDNDRQADVDRRFPVILSTDRTLHAPLVQFTVIAKETPC